MNLKAAHIFLILNLILCQKTVACFCVEENIETADYASYDELFLGKILNIERIEIDAVHENEKYELIGTITTFKILKKWKGSSHEIVKIYQQQNSCWVDFSINNTRWIVSACSKPLVTAAFRKEYSGKYLQTDNCSLIIEETDFENFENDIKKLDKIFPKAIDLIEKSNYWLYLIPLSLIVIVGVILFRKRNTRNIQ